MSINYLQAVSNNGSQITTNVPVSTVPSVPSLVVATNSVKLPAHASSSNNFYLGYTVLIKRQLADGSSIEQTKKIVEYNGANKIAKVDSVWIEGLEPSTGDSILVFNGSDKRVSINPVIQLTDYLSSVSYGPSLVIGEDINLESVCTSALVCDTKSDVTVKYATGVPNIGGIYKYTYSGVTIWEGVVDSSGSGYTTFTNCIGKLTNLWNSWKSFKVGELVYNGPIIYLVTTAGVKTTKPVHTSGTTNGLQVLSSISIVGPTTLSLDISSGNPIKALNNKGVTISGYSIYDADSISYWKYLGWEEHSQDNATLHQTNAIIDPSVPIFDNINTMLSHYNGIMSYIGGQYHLNIETIIDSPTPVYFSEGHIVGTIELEDSGVSKAYNTVAASFVDPSNRFENKSVSLYNSTYLAQDRNVSKRGNINISNVTNYYNVRLLADSYLKKSRFGGSISVTLTPEFLDLIPGAGIAIYYERYGWYGKVFRIKTITLNTDCTLRIVAEEYDPSFYGLSNLNKQKYAGITTTYSTPKEIVEPPINLASQALDGGISITWDNSSNNFSTKVYTEIFYSDNPTDGFVMAGSVPYPESSYTVLVTTDKTKIPLYFKARYRLDQ